ncbi:MAG TPA: AMIN domain-containing protein [Longimicrobiales bacterium]|nr:AMIN domain-containing protein [Longimicrobiales bacterium]
MTPMVALWAAALTVASVVQGVRVAPMDDLTEVVIEIDGAATASAFTLSNPDRLVLDLEGAGHAIGRDQFTGIERGGVRNIRIGQFTPETLRIVIDLTRPTEYAISREPGRVRITFPNPAGPFEPWQFGQVGPNGAGTGGLATPVVTPESGGAALAVAPQQSAQDASSAPLATVSFVPEAAPAANAGLAMAVTPAAAPPAQQPTAIQTQPAEVPALPPATAAQAPAATTIQQAVSSDVVPIALSAATRNTRVTVSFRDTPLLDVLATFADFAGRSIVPGSDISGTVNATINDQPWDVALESILQAHNLAIRETEAGILRVDRLERLRERELLEDLVTVPFNIRYASVDSIAPAIEGLISSRGAVTRNRATNTLIVTDAQSIVENSIAPLIQQLDVRTPQVNVSAKIVFIDRTELTELGIIYDLKDSRGNQLNSIVTGLADLNGDGILESTDANVVLLGGNSIAGLANASIRVAQPQLQIVTSLVLNRHSLINFIEALGQSTLSEVQAAPTVTVLANREAVVQVGERTPIRVIDAGTSASGEGLQAPRATVSFQETGIILRVRPYVVGDQVLLDLRAENSGVAAAPADIGFTFSTQNAETQVLVNDGETTVIGGLTVVEKSHVTAGIPLLMDIPVLGALFRTTREREAKRDLLIMVTPNIVREAGQ